MVSKDKLKEYASKLMFDMNETEYETLESEFEIILKQMDLIGKIEDIEKVEPMIFPFDIKCDLRSDEVKESLDIKDILSNTDSYDNNQIKVPKVVE